MLQNFKNREFSDESSNISTPSISYLARTNAQIHFSFSLFLSHVVHGYTIISVHSNALLVTFSISIFVRAVSRTGNSQIRRSSNRTTKRGQVRPTTATFSFYANFVNTLFSRLSYFSRHAISHHRTVPCVPSTAGQADEPKTKYSRRKEIIEKQFIARTAYYVKTYRSISESLMNLIMITRMLAYVSSHIFIIHRLRKNSSLEE